MDFFAHQEKAKKRTFFLLSLFAFALIGIVGVTYLIFAWINAYAVVGPSFHLADLWFPQLFSWVAILTLLVVGIATLWKISQLKSGGGAYVATSLGGRLISPGTKNSDERKLLNVVEEVAIASGVPTPPVYLLKENGINAFAAGYTSDSAVIGITKGAIEVLNRDELQGVIAHEFSHILNGDMRINIRLIGALFGIMAMGLIGYYTLRSAIFTRHQNSKGGTAGLILVMSGLGLMAIGFVGTFFGQLIKAAVSRQREFLADASAVQFTRNPEGIGNALRKIRDFQYGSRVMNAHASEVSHMFFAKGVFSGFTALFSTHPPLSERIERIFGVDAKMLKSKPPASAPTIEDLNPSTEGVSFLSSSGQPDIEQIIYAKKLVASAPAKIKSASQDPFGARAVVYGFLLSQDPIVRKVQLNMLSKHSYLGVYRELLHMIDEIDTIEYGARIPLLDNMIPALSMLSKSQYEVFRNNIHELIYIDNRIDLFEWVLEKIIVRHLDAHFFQTKKQKRGVLLSNTQKEIQYLLAVLSSIGHNSPEAFEEALFAGMEKVGVEPVENFEFELDFQRLDQAIERLDQLGSKAKKKLLEGCIECIHYDKVITQYEAELFRAIGDALGVPVPLLVPTG